MAKHLGHALLINLKSLDNSVHLPRRHCTCAAELCRKYYAEQMSTSIGANARAYASSSSILHCVTESARKAGQ